MHHTRARIQRGYRSFLEVRGLLGASAMIRFAVLSLLLAGCSFSSLDDEVLPRVVSARVSVDSGQPDALAFVSVRLELQGGSRASSPALIDKVALDDSLELDLAYPAGFTPYIHPSEVKTVDLVNEGTTNADLEPRCGQSMLLEVWIADANEPNAWTIGSAPVAIGCP